MSKLYRLRGDTPAATGIFAREDSHHYTIATIGYFNVTV
jgi:hypothetical protein